MELDEHTSILIPRAKVKGQISVDEINKVMNLKSEALREEGSRAGVWQGLQDGAPRLQVLRYLHHARQLQQSVTGRA